MTLTINLNSYIDLLNRYEISPKIIENQLEYEQFLAVTENLLSKRSSRTEVENVLFRLLVKPIRDYEEKTYALQEWMQTTPHEFLKHLMESRGLKQVELGEAIGLSKGHISAIVNGKKEISKAQAKKLGEFFHVSPSAFI
ncbi:MAG: helix-turn-helix transcriptional regulator [Cyanosarcina radialis HA8281-LM2]|nr:helix-turn-helix transcriptional regulator [Cyanosarcina radialis HA8281-LM2]